MVNCKNSSPTSLTKRSTEPIRRTQLCRPKISWMNIGKPNLKQASFRCEGIFLYGQNPRTWPSATLREVHIGSKIPELRKEHDGVLPDQYLWLQSTKVVCRTRILFRPLNEKVEDSRFSIVPGKTLYALNNDEHAPRLLAIFVAKIGFCLLQESSYRFLRNQRYVFRR